MNVLEEAARVIADRAPLYGDPRKGYTQLAALWRAALGVPVTAEQVVLCLILMKVSRELGVHQRDNLVDIAGYAANLARILGDE